jgi:hypothetical protein
MDYHIVELVVYGILMFISLFLPGLVLCRNEAPTGTQDVGFFLLFLTFEQRKKEQTLFDHQIIRL